MDPFSSFSAIMMSFGIFLSQSYLCTYEQGYNWVVLYWATGLHERLILINFRILMISNFYKISYSFYSKVCMFTVNDWILVHLAKMLLVCLSWIPDILCTVSNKFSAVSFLFIAAYCSMNIWSILTLDFAPFYHVFSSIHIYLTPKVSPAWHPMISTLFLLNFHLKVSYLFQVSVAIFSGSFNVFHQVYIFSTITISLPLLEISLPVILTFPAFHASSISGPTTGTKLSRMISNVML